MDEEAKVAVDLDDEDEEFDAPNFAIGFDLKMSAFLVVWTILMLTFYVWNTSHYAYVALFFNSAIVVGSAIVLLVVYEYSRGNVFSLPKIGDYKTFTNAFVRIVGFIVALIVGTVFILSGVMAMILAVEMTYVFWQMSFILGFALTICAVFVIAWGLNFVKPLLLIEEKEE